MVLSKRKRGGQPSNQNALKHGRFSVPLRAARRAAILAEWEERERQSRDWVQSCPQTDYGAIVDRIRELKQQKDALTAAAVLGALH